MTLNKLYKRGVVLPSLIVFILASIYAIMDNYNYKSEWLTAGYVIFMSIVFAFIYCLIFSLLSLTIFLNKYKKISDNYLLNFLSWFLCPFGFILVILVHEFYYNIRYDEHFDKVLILLLIIHIPLIFGLIWSFLTFKKFKPSSKFP